MLWPQDRKQTCYPATWLNASRAQLPVMRFHIISMASNNLLKLNSSFKCIVYDTQTYRRMIRTTECNININFCPPRAAIGLLMLSRPIKYVLTLCPNMNNDLYVSRGHPSWYFPFRLSPQWTPKWFSLGIKTAACWCLPWVVATSATQRGKYQNVFK